jgi:phosphoribosylformylglycinamidine (FGAM) synthase PurS component
VDAGSREAADAAARQMCERLLANPVTEDFSLTVEA